MTPEGKVKAKIKKYLDSIGAYHFWPVQTGYGQRTLDCLCFYNERGYAFEVKPPGVEGTPRQDRIIEEMLQKGARWAGYVRSVDDLPI